VLSVCKGSANRAKNQIYLDFSEMQPTFDKVKGSANRANNQIYLSFSEMQPTFDCGQSY
jgi:hypothetical protein